MSSPAQYAVALPFRAVAAVRGARAVHPQGFLATGTWRIDRASPLAPAADVLQPGTELPVLARCSRGAGFPEAVGDFFGIAMRLLDAHGPDRHQDVLCNSSVDLPLLHHVFLPAPRWYAQSSSTCLPYDAGAGPVLIGLVPPGRPGPGPELDALRGEIRAGQARWSIALARSLGRWQRVGELRLDALVDAHDGDVDYDPVLFSGGGLRPVGWLNRLRHEAYRQSRLGRHAPDAPRALPR